MKTIPLSGVRTLIAVVYISIGWIFWCADNTFGGDQAPPANLSPGLQEVAKLSQAKMGDDVILAYIKNSGASYTLSADDILYLKDQGVSQNVISALLQTKPDSASPGNNPAPQPEMSAGPPALDSVSSNPTSANLAGASPTVGPSTTDLNRGLIAYYPLDGNANDASGNGLNGTLQNSPAFIAGPFGQAIHLVGKGGGGTAGQHVTIPPIDFSGMVDFTISLWANIEGDSSGTKSGEALISYGGDCPDRTHVVKIWYVGYPYTLEFHVGTADIDVPMNYWNQWHRYSMVYSNGVVTAYLDGQIVGTANGSVASVPGTAGMGIHWWCNNPVGVSTRFIGSLSDVRIYNRALSPGEVAQLVQLDVTTPPRPLTPVVSPIESAPPPPAPVVAPVPAPAMNFTYFHDQLAPFGTWVEVPGYGTCWYPQSVIAQNPDWRPYYDSGRWVQTENGLFWQSDYNWGDIPFHYGRWIRDPRYGWLWVPDYTWGPAWVCWRQAEADGYIGWAPLPYGAVWVDGGWRIHNRAVVDVGFDFGLGEDFFVFVSYDHFHEEFPHRLRGHYGEYVFHVPRERVHEFYGRAVVRNDFRSDEHGRFVNGGIGRERLERIAQATHHPMEQAHFEERHPVGDRNQLVARRTEEARQQAGQGHEQSDKPRGQPPASVSKVYRPPVEKPIPAGTSTPPPKNTGTHSGK
jgi:hypothetical protein